MHSPVNIIKVWNCVLWKKSALGITTCARWRTRMGQNKKLSCNAVSMMASIQSHRSPESTSHYFSLPQEWGMALSTWLSPGKQILEKHWWLRVSDANIFILVGVKTSVLKCTVHYIKSMLKIFQWLLVLFRIKFTVLWRPMITPLCSGYCISIILPHSFGSIPTGLLFSLGYVNYSSSSRLSHLLFPLPEFLFLRHVLVPCFNLWIGNSVSIKG